MVPLLNSLNVEMSYKLQGFIAKVYNCLKRASVTAHDVIANPNYKTSSAKSNYLSILKMAFDTRLFFQPKQLVLVCLAMSAGHQDQIGFYTPLVYVLRCE